jgi:hypothetical protein
MTATTSVALSARTLPAVAGLLSVPAYDRRTLAHGVVHILSHIQKNEPTRL